MSDIRFNKEELEILLNSLCGGIHDDFQVIEEKKMLQEKIQFMIENQSEKCGKNRINSQDNLKASNE